MSYTFLQAREAESWEECCSDTPQFALWKSSLTAEKSFFKDSETESCRSSQSGTTLGLSAEHLGADESMLFAEDSRAKTLAAQEKAQVSKASDLECGSTWRELLVKFDLATHSWKTHLCLWDEDLPWSLVTLPKWGMMLDGVCWEQLMPVRHTDETEYGLWPTPRAGNPGSRPNGKGGKVLAEEVAIAEGIRKRGQRMWPTPTCHNAKECDAPAESTRNTPTLCHLARGGDKTQPKHLNPTWVEWLMGWPLEWTDLRPLETAKFRLWLHSHGESFQEPTK